MSGFNNSGVDSLQGTGSRSYEGFKSGLFKAVLAVCLVIGIATLIVLVIQIYLKGSSRINLNLLSEQPSSLPLRAGAQSAVMGTISIMAMTALICLPIGIGAAVYLEEYANPERWYNRLIEVNIQNLAAVPSIIYGMLGLGIFARGLNLGFSLITGALTLSLLVLPTVIIASREAIRAVPKSIRFGAFALGATQWQAVRRQVLPAAIPGMATGSILALSRAIGETAPLIMLGALTFITSNPPNPLIDPGGFIKSDFTVLPIQIYNWISRSQEDFQILAAAAIIVLLALLLSMNAFAIFIRNRFERKW